MAFAGENVLIRLKQGGKILEIASAALVDVLSGGKIALVGAGGLDVNSGGEISVKSGGSVDFLAGALVEFAGVDKRAELVAAVLTPVNGQAAGYKLERGVFTPTGGSDTIVTGLATVVSVVVSLEDEPTLTHMFTQGDIGDQAGSPAAGSFIMTSSKPTGSGDVTPVAATTPFSPVNWVAIGT